MKHLSCVVLKCYCEESKTLNDKPTTYMIYGVPEDLWIEVCNIVQELGIKTIPKKKKCKKANWLSENALKIPEEREVKGK